MLSKIRSFSPLLQNNFKRTFSKKTQTTPPPGRPQAKEEFIDASKFKDNILMLYQSKEATSSKVISFFLLTLGIYDGYSYYKGEEPLSSSSEGLMALFIFGFLAAFEMKLHKTPKSISLDKDGQTIFLDLYRFFGFGSKLVEVNIREFRGYGPYFKKYSKVPIARYNLDGKKKFFFFKPAYIIENELLRKAFNGYTFKVGDEFTNIHISKKAKSKYDI